MIAGYHHIAVPWTIPGFRDRYHIVSVSYRKIPQVRLADSVEDILDSVIWLRENLPGILGEGKVDLDRYIIQGSSAGALLATLAATKLTSLPPRAVLNVYGPVDMLDESLNKRPPPSSPEQDEKTIIAGYTLSQIKAGFKDHDPSHALTTVLEDHTFPIEQLREAWDDDTLAYDDRNSLQSAMKVYMDTNKLYSYYIFRRHLFDTEESFEEEVKSGSPYWILDKMEDGSYPPTFILSGTKDKTVPDTINRRFAEKLRVKGVEVEESYEPGAGHAFDYAYRGPQDEGWDEYIQPAIDFVDKHLGAK